MSGGWLAAQGRLPLAFVGLGLGWLAIATSLLAWHPATLTQPHVAPHVIALAHAWILGFFVTIACGAMYQLVPVALGTTLWNERRGWWHFGLHAVGVPGMVYSFWAFDLRLLGHFGAFVALGILLFAENIWRTVYRSGRGNPVAWSIALATGWLLLTVLAGLTLAANRFWHFIPIDPVALLRAHAHLGLVGFFLTLLTGVPFQLIPMFTLGEVRDWRPVWLGLGLTQAGLVGLTPTLVWHKGYIAAAFASLILAGMGASGWALVRTLATRKKRALDPGVRAFAAGVAALGVTASFAVALVWPQTPWGSEPGGPGAMVYAVLLVSAGLLPIFTGILCKIVPFLTWMRAYGPRVGRGPTPSAGALANPRLETWAFRLQAVATALLVAGAWFLDVRLLRAGAWVLAGGVGLFLANMLTVLRHLWSPATPSSLNPTKP